MYQQQGNPWKPGVWARLPWSGLLSVVGAVIATVATIAVLTSSNGKPTREWPSENYPIQPAVLLAILTTIANALISYALYEGAALAWWIKMLRGGTLQDCHRYWEYGSSAWKSLIAGRDMNKIAVASLLSFLVFVDGPLMQRASSTSALSITTPTNVSAFLSSAHFASNYSGVYMTRANTVSGITAAMAEVVRDFNSRKPMTLNATGCTGVCRGELVGPGWDVSCNSSTHPLNMTSPISGTTFLVGYARVLHVKYYPNNITIRAIHKPHPGYVNDLVVTTCLLRGAIVRYAVELTSTNNSSSSSSPPSNNTNPNPDTATVTLIPPSSTTENTTISMTFFNASLGGETSGLGYFPSSLGGFALAAKTIYDSNVTIYYTGGSYALDPSTFGPMVYTQRTPGDTAIGAADMTWVDPSADIISALREMAFRAAIGLTNSSAAMVQRVGTGEHTVTITVYESNFTYLAGALAVMVLAVAAVIPLFLGWWRLGREVSLSPVETARAFNAPLLAGVDSNEEIEVVMGEVGHVKIRYAAVQVGDGRGEGQGEGGRLLVVMEGEKEAGRPEEGVVY